jgi:hypothetical protein
MMFKAALAKRRPDRGRRIGGAGGHLQFEESSDFLCHNSPLFVVRILTVGDRLTSHICCTYHDRRIGPDKLL